MLEHYRTAELLFEKCNFRSGSSVIDYKFQLRIRFFRGQYQFSISRKFNISRISQYTFLYSEKRGANTHQPPWYATMQRGKDTPAMLLNSLPKFPFFSLLSQYFSSAIWQVNHITPFYSSPCQWGRTIVAELWCVKSWHILFQFPKLLEIVKHPYCFNCFIFVRICIFLSAWQADTAFLQVQLDEHT